MAAAGEAWGRVTGRRGYRLLALTGLLVSGAVMRLPSLAQRELVEGDGVHYASLARQALIGDFSGLANPYWSNLWPGIIAATSLVTGLDVVGAGRLASLLAGVGLGALTAILGARLFGRVEGFMAGLAVVVHPWLIQFSTLVFTESLFSLLLVAILLAGWRTAEAPSVARGALAGALAGAGLLTRPEAYGLILVVAGLVLVAAWRRGERRLAASAVAAFLLIAAAVLGARALLIHHYHQEWDFGQIKGTANLLVGIEAEKERAYSAITPEGENSLEVQMREWTFGSFVLAHPGLVLRHLATNLVVLAQLVRRVFPPLPVTMGREAFLETPLWTALDVAAIASIAVAMLGLASGLSSSSTRRAAVLCGAVIVVHLLGLAPLYVHERMIVAVVPVFLLLLAKGLVVSAALLARRPLALREAVSLFVPLAALSLFGLQRSPTFDYATEPLVQKEAGLWLRQRFPQSLRLMTVSPSIAFYFYDAEHQGNEVGLPWAEYPALLSYARREAVDLLAASQWQLEAAGFPTAPQLVPEGPHPGLAYVATVGEEPRRVHVFRLDPSAP